MLARSFVLIDAGPIVALFDKSEKTHKVVLEMIKQFKGTLVSTWPVIAEAMHLLRRSHNMQVGLLKWLNADGINLFLLEPRHLARMLTLTEKYKNIPMDLADCSLIIAAEEMEIPQIMTIDSDFAVYRIKGKGHFRSVNF